MSPDKELGFGIYIHIPFCEKICSYCDYFVVRQKNDFEHYVQNLIKEIDIACKDFQTPKKAVSLYFGGGTPSLLSPLLFEKILQTISKYFIFDEKFEFCMESNPNTLSLEKLQDYKSLGFNRISIGVQSLQKSELGLMARNHSPNVAITSIQNAIKSGFNNVNADLIFSIPNQTIEILEQNLTIVNSLGVSHLSAYSLIYEPGTKLFQKVKSGIIKQNNDDFDAQMYEFVMNFVTKNNYEQYEVSNFAKEKMYCKHNLHAWHGNEYYAFGVSSHGYIDGIRYHNFRDMKKYFELIGKDELPIENKSGIDADDKMIEYLFLSIRADGIDKAEFYQKFSKNIMKMIPNAIDKFEKEGYLINTAKTLRLTSKGYAMCDSITLEIVTEAEEKI